MNASRKRLILIAIGVVGLYYFGSWVYSTQLSAPLEASHKRAAKLRDDIQQRQRDLRKARDAAKRLEVYKAQSLPSNPEVARSLYRSWLLEILGRAGMTNQNVDSGSPVYRKGLYHILTFSMRGRATLEQLTRFLYQFYTGDHLQQIRSLSIMPQQGTDILDVAVNIEALILPGSDQKDALNPKKSERLASSRLEDYQKVVQRNLFGISGGIDPTTFTYLTSVNYVNGFPEVWFTVRTSDTVLKLQKGQTLEVGQFKGVVADVQQSDVILESEGERWLLSVGESLGQAAALPPEF